MSLLRFIKRDRAERPVITPVVTAPPAPVPHQDAFAPPPLAAAAPVDLDRIRRELQEIQKIVGQEETLYGQVRAPEDAVDVEMKLSELVKLCPQAFKDPGSLEQASQTVIQVSVPDLYGQLTQGRVATKLHLLIADIPADYLSPFAAEHADDAIAMPLSMVVACIQPEALLRRTTSQERDLGDKSLPNLFTPGSVAAVSLPPAELPPVQFEAAPAVAETPAVAPAPVAAEPVLEPVAEIPEAVIEPVVADAQSMVELAPMVSEIPAVEPASVAEQPALEPVAEVSLPVPEPVMEDVSVAAAEVVLPEPVSAPVAEPVAEELSESEEADAPGRLMLAGLDLNVATAEEMHARLGGVGLKLAQRIVACREQGGAFADLFDLARVPGLRAKRYEQVTGLPWNAAYFRHREQVKQILGVDEGVLPDVRQVATRFNELTDFVGCMVIHEDGLVLAQNWSHPSADALGAFAPQMFKKIHRYVKPLKLGEMNSLCFFVGHQPITVVRSGKIYFAALHKPDKLTKKQVSLAQALAMELGRRFAA